MEFVLCLRYPKMWKSNTFFWTQALGEQLHRNEWDAIFGFAWETSPFVKFFHEVSFDQKLKNRKLSFTPSSRLSLPVTVKVTVPPLRVRQTSGDFWGSVANKRPPICLNSLWTPLHLGLRARGICWISSTAQPNQGQ